MTGLDCLREELRKKGFTKAQTENKTVLAVLEILSGSGGRYSDINALENEIKALEQRKRALEFAIIEYERKAERMYKDHRGYIDSFLNALNECETPEARDALKTAQMFINSVSIDTKYDNTAYIIGLASILSQGKTAPIDELRKINTRLPKLERFGDKYKTCEVDDDGWMVL